MTKRVARRAERAGIDWGRDLDKSLLYVITPRDRHFLVRLAREFTISLPTMMALWAEVLDSGDNRAVRRVLIEGEETARSMRPRDAYKHGEFIAAIERPGIRAAFCLRGYRVDAVTGVFIDSANRGASTVRFFSDAEDARSWLED
jgi:hypothetical protein